MALLDPKGPIGADEKSLILLATGLMLLVVVPVIVLTLVFAWRYRAGQKGAFAATYMPEWSHSGRIEAVIWGVPCLIIAALAVVTWRSSHSLDPFRPLTLGNVKPVEVEVVSLDWKWLFIYPELKLASVNELVVPTNTPVEFRLTSASVMNSFFIPQLGSQIYTMTGMVTKLGLIASQPGVYRGISANYSGDGFSGMHFETHAVAPADFQAWVTKVRAHGGTLDGAAYYGLTQPSEDVPVSTYARVSPHVFAAALALCKSAQACQQEAEHGPMGGMHMAMNQTSSTAMPGMTMPAAAKQEH
ncbi:MAG: ubiquinol oxidase subunit II [Rhodospirillales bacterium]|nr:ubiquinol oxidase subunit II [Rhodospirillales bacterium]